MAEKKHSYLPECESEEKGAPGSRGESSELMDCLANIKWFRISQEVNWRSSF
jgi:hypothetical protein